MSRVESERKVRNSFRMESERNPSDSGSRNPGRVGKGRAGQENHPPSSEATRPPARYLRNVAWAKEHVPDEHPPFVAVAKNALERYGQAATPEAIRKRLHNQGRSLKQLNRKERG